MKKSGFLLALVALVLGLASPAGSSVNLKSDLLTVSQLPKGWVAASASNPELPGCKATTLPANPTKQAAVGFNYRALKAFPLIIEVVAEYSDVDKAFNSLTSGLSSCKNATWSKNGKPFTSMVSKMSLGSYGDQSSAYHATVKGSGFSLAADVLVVREGKLLLELQEGNTGSISSSAFRSLTSDAVRKL